MAEFVIVLFTGGMAELQKTSIYRKIVYSNIVHMNT